MEKPKKKMSPFERQLDQLEKGCASHGQTINNLWAAINVIKTKITDLEEELFEEDE